MSEQISCGCEAEPIEHATNALPIDVEGARATELPERVGEALATTYRLDTAPDTFGGWIDRVEEQFSNQDEELSADLLCCTEDTRHRATLVTGESEEFACVLDALIFPFVAGSTGTITSESPANDATVSVSISLDDVSVEPADAVMSVGAPTDAPSDDGSLVEQSYRSVCPVINAFPSRDAYEAWADEHDHPTTSVPIRTALGLAVSVADSLTDPES